jgi:hypothetical protein
MLLIPQGLAASLRAAVQLQAPLLLLLLLVVVVVPALSFQGCRGWIGCCLCGSLQLWCLE